MGIITTLICATLSSSRDLISKQLAKTISSDLSAFSSFLLAVPFYILLLTAACSLGYEDLAVSGTFWQLVMLRALTDALAEWMKMSAFHYADVSLVSPFLALAPLFVLLLAPVLTGDHL